MPPDQAPRPSWTNWVGNQSFSPARMVQARSEADVVAAVAGAARDGIGLRVPGSGHSFTPVVETDGILLDASRLTGIISADVENAQVTAWAQTKVCDFGPALWEKGLALSNQGDIDAQAIAGAIATASHGSGIRMRNFSASLAGARIVDGRGEVRVFGSRVVDPVVDLQWQRGELVKRSVQQSVRILENVADIRDFAGRVGHVGQRSDQHQRSGLAHRAR